MIGSKRSGARHLRTIWPALVLGVAMGACKQNDDATTYCKQHWQDSKYEHSTEPGEPFMGTEKEKQENCCADEATGRLQNIDDWHCFDLGM